jgi:hypothetical protein
MRFLATFALRGRVQALAVVCGLAVASLVLFPPLSLLSTALLALVALRQGAKESAWVLLLSLLTLGIAGVASDASLEAILYGASLWLPVWPMALLLRETCRLDWTVEAAAGLGLLAVLSIYLLVDDPVALWREKLQLFAQPLLENTPPDFNAAAFGKMLDLLAHYSTGLIVGSSVLSLFIGLIIARWQQAALFNPGGFRTEFSALRLHRAMAYAVVAGIALAFSGQTALAEIAWNLDIVFLALCTLAGFSVVHTVLNGKTFWLVGVYMALFIASYFVLPLLALIGLSDALLDWRRLSKQQA